MRRRMIILAAVAVLGGAGLAAAQMGGGMMGQGMRGGMGPGMMGSARHNLYMHEGLPPAYAGKTNPLKMTPALLGEGRKLFAANCAVCHGAEGHGDGPMAKSLNPPPADLSATLSMPIAQDDFLYWTIAEGGAPVGSAMPAFKTTLKPDQIWSVVSALRSGDLKGK